MKFFPGAPPSSSNEAGYSLMELMIGSLVAGMLSTGIVTMVMQTQAITTDSGVELEARQSARMALDKMQRELMNAGIGLQDLVAPFAPLEPRDDGGVAIRWNPTGLVEALQTSMLDGHTSIDVVSTSGFVAEQYVLVTDSAGNSEMLQLREVTGSRLNTYGAVSTDFLVSSGASVSSLTQVQYWVDDSTGTSMLWRQIDGQAATPIAGPVTSFSIEYWDDSDPSVQFTPNTVPEMMRIRAVDAAVTIEGGLPSLRHGVVPTATLELRAVPRAVLLVQ